MSNKKFTDEIMAIIDGSPRIYWTIHELYTQYMLNKLVASGDVECQIGANGEKLYRRITRISAKV
jgi:hypothetical protein